MPCGFFTVRRMSKYYTPAPNPLEPLLTLYKKVNAFLKNVFKAPPRRYWTSDLHFGHNNVINYCDRPWASKEEMNEAIVAIWNKKVRPQDTVYVLGDFSLNPKAVLNYGPRLNGTKILVVGNHDACFEYEFKRKANNMRDKYLNQFQDVQNEIRLKLKNGTEVLMSHFPYSLEYDQRYKKYRPEDKGGWLLHGHLHAKYIKNNKQIDVGFDGSLTLHSEDDIIALMEDERDFIPSRITEFYKQRGTEKRNNMKGEDI